MDSLGQALRLAEAHLRLGRWASPMSDEYNLSYGDDAIVRAINVDGTVITYGTSLLEALDQLDRPDGCTNDEGLRGVLLHTEGAACLHLE
jgi:hypothetical protein